MGKEKEKVSLNDLIKDLQKTFGETTITKLGDAKTVKVDVIPTGSFALDMALGVGGLPKGRIVEIYGPESGGKTTLCLTTIAQAQKMGGTAAFIDVECAFDAVWAAKIGVDVKNLYFVQPDKAEDALNIAEKLISSNSFDIIVVDSVAALVPNTEVEAEIGNQTMGLRARLLNQALRKLTPAVSRSNTLLIFINQVRQKMGASPYENPEVTPGGNALKFASSVRIDIRKVSPVKDEEEVIGITVRAKVSKNKVAPPFRKAEFVLLFSSGISRETDVFNIGVERNLIEKQGISYFWGKEKIGVGLKNSINALKENKELCDKIAAKIQEVSA